MGGGGGTLGKTAKERRWEGRVCARGLCGWEGESELDLLGLGSAIVLDVGTTTRTNRELDPVAFELTTELDRLHRSGVLV